MTLIRLLSSTRSSPSEFYSKYESLHLKISELLNDKYGIPLTPRECSDLALAVARIDKEPIIQKNERGYRFIDEEELITWFEKEIVPNTLILRLTDPEIIKLFLFSIEITFQMFEGGSRATTTQIGNRAANRPFEAIVDNMFTGKIGEIFVKKYLEEKFGVDIQLDWEISPDIEHFRNDILNAKKLVDIKSTGRLSGIYAEAPKGFDYAIWVKTIVPKPLILRFIAETEGMAKSLEVMREKLSEGDSLFLQYIENIRRRILLVNKDAGDSVILGIIHGFFKTADYKPLPVGHKLEFLGNISDEKYMIPFSELRNTEKDWEELLKDIGLLS